MRLFMKLAGTVLTALWFVSASAAAPTNAVGVDSGVDCDTYAFSVLASPTGSGELLLACSACSTCRSNCRHVYNACLDANPNDAGQCSVAYSACIGACEYLHEED